MCDLGLVKNLISGTKNMTCKQKIDKWTLSKFKTLPVKDVIQGIVFKSQLGGKYLQITHLKEELYLGFKGKKSIITKGQHEGGCLGNGTIQLDYSGG